VNVSDEELRRAERSLTDQGKLIEAGWISLRVRVVPLDASTVQLREMRMAFFGGAAHLFHAIMTVLEPGAEPTDKDMQRMSLIQTELAAFALEAGSRHKPGSG
jgi:hypothetical protein